MLELSLTYQTYSLVPFHSTPTYLFLIIHAKNHETNPPRDQLVTLQIKTPSMSLFIGTCIS